MFFACSGMTKGGKIIEKLVFGNTKQEAEKLFISRNKRVKTGILLVGLPSYEKVNKFLNRNA